MNYTNDNDKNESDKIGANFPVRAVRLDELPQIIGLTTRTIRTLMNTKNFPIPIRLTKKAIGFYEHEIQEWLKNRPRV